MKYVLIAFICSGHLCNWRAVQIFPSRAQCENALHGKDGYVVGAEFVLARCKPVTE